MGYLRTYPPVVDEPPAGEWAAHPRVWLTPDILTDLRAKRTANTAEWQTFSTAASSALTHTYDNGYGGATWLGQVLLCGLMYQILKPINLTTANQYGSKGLVYLKALLNDCTVVGDGKGGSLGYPYTSPIGSMTAPVIQNDSGYWARCYGPGLFIGRDWLDGFDDGSTSLDASTISDITATAGTWINYLANPIAYLNNTTKPCGNYYAGFFALHWSAALGLYGDSGYDSAWLTKAQSMWDDDVLPTLAGYGAGDFQTWSYGALATLNLLSFAHAYQTARNDAAAWTDAQTFVEGLIPTFAHHTHPSKSYVSSQGSWSGDIAYKGYPRGYATMSMLSESAPVSATLKGLARWWSNLSALTYDKSQDIYAPVSTLLWGDAADAGTTPSSSTVGLSRSVSGADWGHLMARSDEWTNTNATWVNFWVPRGTYQEIKQTAEQADFELASRGAWLIPTGHAAFDGHDSTLHNVPWIKGSHTYNPGSNIYFSNLSFLTRASDSNYAYAKVGNLHSGYGTSCDYGSRSLVFLPPDLVLVYDNYTVPSTENVFGERFHFWNSPTISGQTATMTQGSGKVVLTYLTPTMTLTRAAMHGTDLATDASDGTKITMASCGHPDGFSGVRARLSIPAKHSGGDGATNGSTTFTSAASTFGTDVVGHTIYIYGGTGVITPAWYTITARPDTHTLTLNTSTGLTTGTGASFLLGTVNAGGYTYISNASGNVFTLSDSHLGVGLTGIEWYAYNSWWDRHRCDAAPTTTVTSNQIAMTFETMAAAGSSAYTVTELTVSGAKAFYVQNASRSWIVVFTASTTGANLSGTITIDARGASPSFEPTILVADLAASTLYTKTSSPAYNYTLTPGSGTAVDASGLLVI